MAKALLKGALVGAVVAGIVSESRVFIPGKTNKGHGAEHVDRHDQRTEPGGSAL
jgi:hypothetical protein